MVLLRNSFWVLFVLLLVCVAVFAQTDGEVSAPQSSISEPGEPNEIVFNESVGVVLSPSQLRNQKKRAMSQLVIALEAYLAGRLDVAGEYLRKSADNGGYASDVFYSVDSVSLEELLELSSKAAIEYTCQLCGGTEVDDCPVCSGVGWNSCRECKGIGLVTEASRARDEQGRAEYSTDSYVCQVCQGVTVLKCDRCQGSGLVKCDEAVIAELSNGGIVDAPNREGVKRVLAIALYLKAGGADVYSKGALSVRKSQK